MLLSYTVSACLILSKVGISLFHDVSRSLQFQVRPRSLQYCIPAHVRLARILEYWLWCRGLVCLTMICSFPFAGILRGKMQEKGRCDDHDSMACVQDVRFDRLLSVLYGNVERYEEKVKFHKLPLLSS